MSNNNYRGILFRFIWILVIFIWYLSFPPWIGYVLRRFIRFEIIIFETWIIKFDLNLKKFLLITKTNKIIPLNHEEIVVAIGIIMKPTFEKKNQTMSRALRIGQALPWLFQRGRKGRSCFIRVRGGFSWIVNKTNII